MSPLLFPHKGATIIKLVGLILGALMHLVVILILVTSPFIEALILHNKVYMLYLMETNFRWEAMRNILFPI